MAPDPPRSGEELVVSCRDVYHMLVPIAEHEANLNWLCEVIRLK